MALHRPSRDCPISDSLKQRACCYEAIQYPSVQLEVQISLFPHRLALSPFPQMKPSISFTAATSRNASPSIPSSVHVAVRVRPLNDYETKSAQHAVLDLGDRHVAILGAETYVFDSVFDSNETTADLYAKVAEPIVRSSLTGINGTIFAYGQTASGKTFTMQGSEASPGVLRLAAKQLFDTAETSADASYAFVVSYVEIYNERVKDLLCAPLTKQAQEVAGDLKIREDRVLGFYVDGVHEVSVGSYAAMMDVYADGEKRRHVAGTDMNLKSSRSHTIFAISVTAKPKGSAQVFGTLKSRLSLVDLAGSESARLTNAEGERLKEGAQINKSLLSLSLVISSLAKQDVHVKFRDSKLTQILQPSLAGNCRTAVVCCVTPASAFLHETISTLKFATSAKNVQTSYVVNQIANEASRSIKGYQEQVDVLSRALREEQARTEGGEKCAGLEHELELLRVAMEKASNDFEAKLLDMTREGEEKLEGVVREHMEVMVKGERMRGELERRVEEMGVWMEDKEKEVGEVRRGLREFKEMGNKEVEGLRGVIEEMSRKEQLAGEEWKTLFEAEAKEKAANRVAAEDLQGLYATANNEIELLLQNKDATFLKQRQSDTALAALQVQTTAKETEWKSYADLLKSSLEGASKEVMSLRDVVNGLKLDLKQSGDAMHVKLLESQRTGETTSNELTEARRMSSLLESELTSSCNALNELSNQFTETAQELNTVKEVMGEMRAQLIDVQAVGKEWEQRNGRQTEISKELEAALSKAHRELERERKDRDALMSSLKREWENVVDATRKEYESKSGNTSSNSIAADPEDVRVLQEEIAKLKLRNEKLEKVKMTMQAKEMFEKTQKRAVEFEQLYIEASKARDLAVAELSKFKENVGKSNENVGKPTFMRPIRSFGEQRDANVY